MIIRFSKIAKKLLLGIALIASIGIATTSTAYAQDEYGGFARGSAWTDRADAGITTDEAQGPVVVTPGGSMNSGASTEGGMRPSNWWTNIVRKLMVHEIKSKRSTFWQAIKRVNFRMAMRLEPYAEEVANALVHLDRLEHAGIYAIFKRVPYMTPAWASACTRILVWIVGI